MDAKSDRASRRTRRARRERPTGATEKRVPQIQYHVPRFELISAEHVQQIHDASMDILSRLGIAFYDDEAREILASHGARVEGDIVYMDEALVMEYITKAPSEYTQIARNPANNVIFGGNRSIFAPVYGPPFVHDADKGRSEGTLEDFQNFVKLAYMSPYLHHSGGTVCEPNDEPVPTRHLDMVYAHIKYSDKGFMGSVTEPENAADSVQMCEILFGKENIRKNPAMTSLINVSSPRRHDERMLGCMKVYARARQAMIITPFLMAGAMSPASIAGTLALQNAEALSGIAFVQMVEPGCPVVYGSFMTNLDLQSGATVFGSPSSQLTMLAVAQMARRYNLPFRTGGTFSSSKIPDAQAGYESVQVMMPAVQAQTNFILHAAGWLESGLVSGYEKFVIDCELLGMYHYWARGIDFSDEGFALDAFEEVEAGGHFLGTQHTMRHFRDAFHRAEIMDYDAYEQWVINGSEDTVTRANKKWKAMLEVYEAPPLDASIDSQLQDFMKERKTALGFAQGGKQ
ncbi:trimethylamine methyltransferase family protein [Chloroflexi bacterium TSY]|nr:trimethylamine methyltransferase family protein [Chloroflexi bacterium TSY]